MAVRDLVNNFLATAASVLPFRKPEAVVQRIEPSAVADPRNGPAPTEEEMTRELAAPRVGSTRSDVSLGAARGLTPAKLAHILRAAEDGDPDAYLSLAEEMEERDGHYLSVLGTRKRQVAQLPMTLAAASKDQRDQDICKDVQENIIDRGILEAAAFDFLDAIGKGFSLHELVWETTPTKWKLDRLEWVNPRFVRHDRETRREPQLLENGQQVPLQQFKFAYLEIKAKSGTPIRGGLARVCAWAYMAKNFTFWDWVSFCEVYGVPFIVGRFDQTASEGDQDKLLRAVCSLAGDARAIFPKNMDIEIKETGAKTASSALFGDCAAFCNDEMSKAVLGQTGTVSSQPGKLGGQADHTHVREDIERSDARLLEVCINRFIIQPYIIVNYGPQERYPYLTVGRPDPKDAKLMIEAAKLPGFRVAADDLRAAVGFREPGEGDEIYIGGAASSPPLPASPQQITQSLAAARVRVELLAEEISGGADAIALAAKQQARESAELLQPVVDQILAVAAVSGTEAEFRRRLLALKPDLDMSPLGDRLALLAFQSLAGGIVGDTLRH
jgi:phage gp29-like protein